MTGIIGAMAVEVAEIIRRLEHPRTRTVARMDFTAGQLAGQAVVVAVSGVGKVSAAMCAQVMISVYGVTRILNTGVAGGLSPRLRTGDVVLADALVQHDMDTTALGDPMGYLSGLGLVRLPVDPALLDALSAAARQLGLPVQVGTIATGDSFVHTDRQRQHILTHFDALACEMEGGAVAQVCYSNSVPCAVVRVISDTADAGAASDYQQFVHQAAARSISLLTAYLSHPPASV
ncbi:MAG: 5'-methylthioadenosine/adenosylhomocysteine nucleosidase [Eubacteriales bacterium]